MRKMNNPAASSGVSRHCEPLKAARQSRLFPCGSGSLRCARDDAPRGGELTRERLKIRNISQGFLVLFLFQFFLSFPAYAVTTVLDPNTAPDIRRGTAYSSIVVDASGGTAPYTFALATGSSPLPSGMILASDGTLSGITCSPTGNYDVTVLATDSLNTTDTGVVQLTVKAGVSGKCALSISPTSLPGGTQGATYSQTLTASGGLSPYTYSVSSGSLPSGLSLNQNTGVIAGTPETPGVFSFAVVASSSNSPVRNGVQSYSITIASSLALQSTTSTVTRIGAAYSQTNTASSGTGSYTYSISAGALPAGLTLNTSIGTVSGTPTAAGSFSYTVRVSDGATTATQVIAGTMAAPAMVLSPSVLAVPQVGTAYSQTVIASGGTASYLYAVSAGTLPAGLSLNASSGIITGTPTTSGAYNVTLRATDSSTGTGPRAYAAGDVGLYDPAPPEGSAFIRFVSDHEGTGSDEVKANGKTFDYLNYKEVSSYYVLPEGNVNVSLGAASKNFDIKSGLFYTVILGDDNALDVKTDPENSNQAKAQVIFYNLSNNNDLSLKTTDGKVEIITPPGAGSASERQVNPVKVSLAVYDGDKQIKDLGPLSLERSRSYSAFVLNEDDIEWVRSSTNTTR